MRLRKQAHTVYKTQYHVVLVTKYRRKILTKGVEQYLKLIFQEIRKFRPDVEFIEMGMDKDHVHLYMVIPPKYSASEVVRMLKSSSAQKLKAKFSFFGKVYWGTDSVWSKPDFCLNSWD